MTMVLTYTELKIKFELKIEGWDKIVRILITVNW